MLSRHTERVSLGRNRVPACAGQVYYSTSGWIWKLSKWPHFQELYRCNRGQAAVLATMLYVYCKPQYCAESGTKGEPIPVRVFVLQPHYLTWTPRLSRNVSVVAQFQLSVLYDCLIFNQSRFQQFFQLRCGKTELIPLMSRCLKERDACNLAFRPSIRHRMTKL